MRRFFKFKRKKKLGIIFCEVCQCQRLKQIKGPNKLICVIFFKNVFVNGDPITITHNGQEPITQQGISVKKQNTYALFSWVHNWLRISIEFLST